MPLSTVPTTSLRPRERLIIDLCRERPGILGKNIARHLGDREYGCTIRKQLSRLVKRGDLIKLSQGYMANDYTEPDEDEPAEDATESVTAVLGWVRKAKLPSEPTDAVPGTEQKIDILTERAARGEILFHPHDGQRETMRRAYA